MRRDELEHIIRAAGAILGDREVIVLGSQAILGRFPSGLPPEATESMEAYLLPVNDPDGKKADLIDGTLGEGSMFHDTFGIYAHGVDETTARLPDGWRDRLIPVENANTMGITGYCLEPHDLLVSKYLAGRPKDLEFCSAVVRAGLVSERTLLDRLRRTACTQEEMARVAVTIRRHFAEREKRVRDQGMSR
ncbi:DUF6036 family nucleotidyltransferase [Caldinitratiruptor microaerophilus]|uniref:DUF6036 domain-containing protein n=1 Tax=Caldinitratiruptor microaerophilus TaxID=671077 RepID=A0AA35CKY1_9FIRM|nr:DUF6036 family nucleotidyltransferase [Caldinitratiruptor microaerophilus]BDG61012.1 hypothetical protein caldi_21020 [Caldinitratiruptor microaerophilus]